MNFQFDPAVAVRDYKLIGSDALVIMRVYVLASGEMLRFDTLQPWEPGQTHRLHQSWSMAEWEALEKSLVNKT